MRRLIGLIALLALILGAAWLVQHDFDLRQIPGVRTLVGPAPTGGKPAVVLDSTAETPASSATAPVADGTAGEPDAMAAPDRSDVSPAVESEAPLAAESDVATADAQPSEDAGTADESPPPGVIPSFDIVRVEPSGETVIAGLAAPQAMVEVLDGAKSIATAEANERGEWALVLDEPLPPGTHDLAIRTTTPDQSEVTLSDQRVAVSVAENKDEEPLVVLNAPDAPSRIMQVPSEPEVAAALEQTPMADSSPKAEETAAAAISPATAGDTASAAGEPASSEMPPDGEMPSAGEAGEMDIAAAPEPMAEPSVMSPGAGGADARAAGADVADGPIAAPDMPSAGETSVAVAPAPMTKPSAPSPETEVGEATPSAETAGTPMPDTASMPPEAPAEPEGAAMAPAGEASQAPGSAEPQAPAAGEASPAPAAVEEPAPIVPKVGVAAVEAETNGALYVAGTAETPEPVRVYIDDEFIGEATPGEAGTWLLETEREMAPDQYVVRADQVDAKSGAVIARAEVPFEREVEVAVLELSGDSADSGSAEVSGSVAGPMKVIIKRGDNLWRISRAIYGKGLRFSTIYQANRDQIRNPDLIYPGQVFVLPAGNTAWESE